VIPFVNWANAKYVKKTISATAGNVTTNLSPGSSKRWLILRGRIKLVTGATVGSRYIRFQLTDGTNVTEYVGITTAIAESSTKHCDFGQSNNTQNASLGGGSGHSYISLNYPILLEESDQLQIDIVSGLAEDSYEGYVHVLEVDV